MRGLTVCSFLLFGAPSATLGQITEGCWGGEMQEDQPRRSFIWPRFEKVVSGSITKLDDLNPAEDEAAILFDSTAVFDIGSSPSDRLLTIVDGLKGELRPVPANCTARQAKKLNSVQVVLEDSQPLVLNAAMTSEDESYKMRLEPDGDGFKVVIEAKYDVGGGRGLVSLWNMIEARNCNPHYKFRQLTLGDSYYVLPYGPFSVEDKPRLRHRGLMLDTARSYQPVPLLKRIMKTMARAKLNVFHWHATDDQSFPLVIGNSAAIIHGSDTCYESTSPIPCLGAYSNKKIYTQADVVDIIKHASNYGIRVILEIDMPAHARSWGSNDRTFLANTCHSLTAQTSEYCAQPVCGSLGIADDPGYNKAIELAKVIFDDIHALIPSGELFHIGMDEVHPKCFGPEEKDKRMMQWLKDLIDHGKGKNRKLMAWQDALAPHEFADVPDEAPENVVAHVWNDPASGQALMEKGHEIVWSDYKSMYMDCGRGNPAVANYTSWCGLTKTWFDVYQVTPDVLFPANIRDLVLGGEIAMWAEQANELNVESLLWPRGAAWGGAAWEQRTRSPVNTTDFEKDIFEPQDALEEFSVTMFRDCVPFTPMRGTWCDYGDVIEDNDSGRPAEGRLYCDKYAEGFMVPQVDPPPPPPPTPCPEVSCPAVSTAPCPGEGGSSPLLISALPALGAFGILQFI